MPTDLQYEDIATAIRFLRFARRPVHDAAANVPA